MPPLLNNRYLTILKAVCMLGMLVLFLGPAGCSTKGVPRNKEGKTSRDRAARSRGGKAEQTVQLLLDPYVISKSPPAPPPGRNSLSPWNYSYIHDDNLFPSRIAQAECLSTSCLDYKGWNDQDLESKPIHHQILVLRRIKGRGKKNIFRLESRTIRVGCTCVFPNIIHQD
ncbi:hypothetical protein JZ751_010453 [Albula glossodonta]|uniref:Uncharacterized protein n=1 Tax=Albula glossodonta TaxID=121402 RepID=A0A8T2NZ36_9TELE|nr:hypothetical protein JZ751_010453 [Albula glossodonta]